MSMNYGPEVFEYTIQSDDTLWDLADEYGTTVEDIMAANVDLDPDNMYVGQIIYLPDDSQVDASQRRPEYGFRPGRRPPLDLSHVDGHMLFVPVIRSIVYPTDSAFR